MTTRHQARHLSNTSEALEDIESRIAWFRSDFKVDPERTDEINDRYLEIEEMCESVASELALKPELTSVTRHLMIRVSTLKSELEQVRNLHWSRQSDITPRTLRLDSDVVAGRDETVEVDLTVRPAIPGTPPTATSSLNQDMPHDIPQDDALTEFLNSFERPEKDDIDTRLIRQNEKIDTIQQAILQLSSKFDNVTSSDFKLGIQSEIESSQSQKLDVLSQQLETLIKNVESLSSSLTKISAQVDLNEITALAAESRTASLATILKNMNVEKPQPKRHVNASSNIPPSSGQQQSNTRQALDLAYNDRSAVSQTDPSRARIDSPDLAELLDTEPRLIRDLPPPMVPTAAPTTAVATPAAMEAPTNNLIQRLRRVTVRDIDKNISDRKLKDLISIDKPNAESLVSSIYASLERYSTVKYQNHLFLQSTSETLHLAEEWLPTHPRHTVPHDRCPYCASPGTQVDVRQELIQTAEMSLFKYEAAVIKSSTSKANLSGYREQDGILWYLGHLEDTAGTDTRDLDLLSFFDAQEFTSLLPVLRAEPPIFFSYLLYVHFNIRRYAGVELTRREILKKMYPIGGARRIVKKVRNDCSFSRKIAKKTVDLIMSHHSQPRTMIAPVFYNTMADIAYGFTAKIHVKARQTMRVHALVLVCILTLASNILVLKRNRSISETFYALMMQRVHELVLRPNKWGITNADPPKPDVIVLFTYQEAPLSDEWRLGRVVEMRKSDVCVKYVKSVNEDGTPILGFAARSVRNISIIVRDSEVNLNSNPKFEQYVQRE